MLPTRNPQFDLYVEPARGRAEGWRTAAGIIVFLAFVAILSYIIRTYGLFLAERYQLGFGYLLAAELYLQHTKRSVLVSLALIAVNLPLLLLMLKIVHRRGIRGLIGPSGKIDWRLFSAIFCAYALVWIVIAAPGFWSDTFRIQR